MKKFTALLAAFMLMAAQSVFAQTLQGFAAMDITGKDVMTDTLKGNTVLVVFWSTGCPVCRDLMPEFRANVMGWRAKPFRLVLVNVDADRSDWLQYESLVTATKQREPSIVSVYAAPQSVPAAAMSAKEAQALTRPVSLLLDAQGKLIEKYVGRMPSEGWDKIAEML
jgi:thiol-disulfide isomerase/thioredoxin